jgi:hypothetical protein
MEKSLADIAASAAEELQKSGDVVTGWLAAMAGQGLTTVAHVAGADPAELTAVLPTIPKRAMSGIIQRSKAYKPSPPRRCWPAWPRLPSPPRKLLWRLMIAAIALLAFIFVVAVVFPWTGKALYMAASHVARTLVKLLLPGQRHVRPEPRP